MPYWAPVLAAAVFIVAAFGVYFVAVEWEWWFKMRRQKRQIEAALARQKSMREEGDGWPAFELYRNSENVALTVGVDPGLDGDYSAMVGVDADGRVIDFATDHETPLAALVPSAGRPVRRAAYQANAGDEFGKRVLGEAGFDTDLVPGLAIWRGKPSDPPSGWRLAEDEGKLTPEEDFNRLYQNEWPVCTDPWHTDPARRRYTCPTCREPKAISAIDQRGRGPLRLD